MPSNGHPKRFAREEILETYRRHPLREERILERVRARHGSLEGCDALDLARDSETGITDQNHVGGVRFVRALARRSHVCAGDYVLDLGCGLGGSARVLARLYGCRVHGVELSAERCGEAESLTRLVGLQDRVTFERGDFLQMAVPPERYDVIWGQSTWAHVRDKPAFFSRWTPALKSGGRLAFEEVYLRKPPPSAALGAMLEELEDCWKSYIVSEQEWLSSLPGSLRVGCVEDLSAGLVENFRRLLALARRAGSEGEDSPEAAGWRRAHRLAAQGVLGYIRIVASKSA